MKKAVYAKDLKIGMKVGFMGFNPSTGKNDLWCGAVVSGVSRFLGNESRIEFASGGAMVVKNTFLFPLLD